MRRLELGSGYAPWQVDNPEWEHLDLNPKAPHVEWIADLSQPLPFEDGVFGEIRAVDCLEHIGYRHTHEVLAEWARIMTPGGRIYVQCPEAGLIMQWYAQGDQRLCTKEGRACSPREGAEWRLLGGQDDGQYVEDGGDPRLNLHMAFFTKDYVTECLRDAGFVIESLQVNPFPNLLVYATRI